MQKLDRLGWAMGLSFNAYGVRIGIRVKDPEVLRLLPERFPFGWTATAETRVDRLYSVDLPVNAAGSRVRRFSLLHADAAQLARTLNAEELLDALETDIKLYVAENARRRVFVHAGVVGWRGRAILIPGKSYSGKTTLVAELVRAGATYYSDEYAVLDAKGRVHPYAQPLSIRVDGLQQTKHSVESLGGAAGRKALPVGLVAVCRWDGKRWRPRRLSPGLGTLAIVAHTIAARTRTEAVFEAIRMVVSSAPVIEGSRGEAREAAARILEYAERAED